MSFNFFLRIACKKLRAFQKSLNGADFLISQSFPSDLNLHSIQFNTGCFLTFSVYQLSIFPLSVYSNSEKVELIKKKSNLTTRKKYTLCIDFKSETISHTITESWWKLEVITNPSYISILMPCVY